MRDLNCKLSCLLKKKKNITLGSNKRVQLSFTDQVGPRDQVHEEEGSANLPAK